MNTKEMRQKLREEGFTPPRKNDVMIELYNKTFPPEILSPTVKLASSNTYTYVGLGESPPHIIKFMGEQTFVRGEPTEVKLSILNKVENNPSFVKGKINPELLHDQDIEAKKEADNQRVQDTQTQLEAMRQRGK